MSGATTDPGVRDPLQLPASDSNALARRLAERIRRSGPIPFAAFMEAALYDPQDGYYRSGRRTVGREGDYLTSPEVHPLFGYAVAAQVVEVWERIGRPAPFTLREVGPGSGACIEPLLAWVRSQRPDCWDALHVELVEPSAAARDQQARRLGDLGERVRWLGRLDEGAAIEGAVFANELLDAQPVHRLRWNGEAWEELLVGLSEEGGLRDVAGPVSRAELLAPLAGVAASPGQIVEVCPGLAGLVEALASGVGRGLLLLFDYGYPRARLYAPWRREGTLMTFHRHTPGAEPYVRVGEQDITGHIDLDSVRAAATRAGLRAYPVRSQAEFLAAMGATHTDAAADAGRGAHLDTYLSRRRAVEALCDPGGLGRIAVLGFGRGVSGPLRGLGDPAPAEPGGAE